MDEFLDSLSYDSTAKDSMVLIPNYEPLPAIDNSIRLDFLENPQEEKSEESGEEEHTSEDHSDNSLKDDEIERDESTTENLPV